MYRDLAQPGPILVVSSRKSVTGVDRDSGVVRWKHALSPSPHWKLAVARVVVEGEHVVVVSAEDVPAGWFTKPPAVGTVTCLDYRSGRLLWQQRFDIGANAAAQVATLLCERSQVFVSLAGCVVAYSLPEGTLQWSHDADEDGADSLALSLPGFSTQTDARG